MQKQPNHLFSIALDAMEGTTFLPQKIYIPGNVADALPGAQANCLVVRGGTFFP